MFAGTAIVVVVCLMLGFWQLRRLHDRRTLNEALRTHHRLAVVEMDRVELRGGRADFYAYRRAHASGRYDISHEVVLRARSLNGQAGNHVLTPLRLEDGTGVIVDRGWVPIDHESPPVSDALPPSGVVSITGALVPTEPKQILFGPSDPPRGPLRTIGRINVPRLAKQIPYRIRPLYLVLEQQSPSQPSMLPVKAGLPEPGDGPHLAYAVQWFLFAVVAAVTAFFLARREKYERAKP
ncbi:MAG: SURF1 family protein [Actinomycetota bacterium]